MGGGGGADDAPVFWKSFLAGNVGGMLGQMVSYPIDTVRIRMQTEAAVRGRSMFYAARHIMRTEGGGALYRGLLVPTLGYGSINAVAFATNDMTKGMFQKMRRSDASSASGGGGGGGASDVLPTWQLVICGMNAGAVSALVRAPIERVKTVMQTAETADGKRVYSGGVEATRAIVREQGMRGLFVGTPSTVIREVIQFGMYYPAYELIKRAAEEHAGPVLGPYAWLAIPCAGGLAGAFQWLPPSYCVDVVKSRMQADTVGKYASMLDCAAKAHAGEGAVVFVRGLGPTLIRAFPLHAGVFTGYEVTLGLLKGM